MKLFVQSFIILIIVVGCGNITSDPNGNKLFEYYYSDGSIEKRKTIKVDSTGKPIEYWECKYP